MPFPENKAVTSSPIRIFPNNDCVYVQLTKKNGSYECTLLSAPGGKLERAILVAKVRSRTMRDAQERIYKKGIDNYPSLPKPPYIRRGEFTFVATNNKRAGDPVRR